MWHSFKILTGCLIVLTGAADVHAQMRARRIIVITPPQTNQQMNSNQQMNPMMTPANSPIVSIFPSPFSLAHLQRRLLMRSLNPYANNPYMSNSYGSNTYMSSPYMMSNPYMAYSGGYGGSNSGSYSGSGSGYSQANTTAANNTQPSANAGTDLSSLLTALGIPNQGGQLEWPLAFRLIPAG